MIPISAMTVLILFFLIKEPAKYALILHALIAEITLISVKLAQLDIFQINKEIVRHAIRRIS